MVGKTAPNTPSSPVAHLTFRFTNVAPVERALGMNVINPGRAQPGGVFFLTVHGYV